MFKKIRVIGGGTLFHVRPHLTIGAPAYGNTAKIISGLTKKHFPWPEFMTFQHLTKMADPLNSNIETNEDISDLVDECIADPNTKVIFMSAALCDWNASVWSDWSINPTELPSGKDEPRLRTQDGHVFLRLTPADKIINKIRKERKDIFLVGFKTTAGESSDEQFYAGLNLLKKNSCNLVLANDVHTRVNMIITPEQARYTVSTDRNLVLEDLVKMTLARSSLTFTRSTVVEGDPVAWSAPEIPDSLRTVVNYCIDKGAYKPFNGVTVGHFACKINNKTFLTSRRKTNFNNLNEIGLVKIETNGPDSIIAIGSRPSVGGMSQRIIFKYHPEMDCIVHFHIEHKPEAKLSHRSQKYLECGSHQCGINTSEGLREEVSGIKCVFLDNHGPNIVFNRNIDPNKVIKFIDENFDFNKSTDGVNR